VLIYEQKYTILEISLIAYVLSSNSLRRFGLFRNGRSHRVAKRLFREAEGREDDSCMVYCKIMIYLAVLLFRVYIREVIGSNY
jgi:hypothetical protein